MRLLAAYEADMAATAWGQRPFMGNRPGVAVPIVTSVGLRGIYPTTVLEAVWRLADGSEESCSVPLWVKAGEPSDFPPETLRTLVRRRVQADADLDAAPVVDDVSATFEGAVLRALWFVIRVDPSLDEHISEVWLRDVGSNVEIAIALRGVDAHRALIWDAMHRPRQSANNLAYEIYEEWPYY